ncbi:MFS transporter [Alkalicoccobacillus porphyridii]|uniref:MFS transporter n=1 Tax=Alkalicoccobacillus porphyridii TaxID=2597270 RepID=A0A553ZVS6_9BACI|nr:MFS transporter [Alkalicoccobacillus porphyridii]TSB45533.1 MFS transporter [Alkalicoccobacillus porphyridii]
MALRKEDILPTTPKSLWRNRSFLLLWLSGFLGNFGFQIYSIVIPLLIYEMTQSPLAMSGMRIMEFLPNVLLGMVAGVIVDRMHRKKIMLITVGLQWLAVTCILFLLITQMVAMWSLFLLGFLFSSSGYFKANATHSALPQIVRREQLTEANSKMGFTDTLVRTIGPGVAGALIAISSFTGTLTVQFVCMTLVVLTVCFIHISPAPPRPKSIGFIADMKEGIHELFQNKTLLTPTVAVIFQNFASSMVMGVLIFFSVDQLGSSEADVGLMISLGGIGGLLGALLVKRLSLRISRGKLYTYTQLGEVMGYAILLIAQAWWMIGISLAIRTFAITISNILYFSIRQEFTPNHLLGRVAGTSSMMMKLATPLGLFAAGLWAEYFSIRVLFIFTICISITIFCVLIRTTFYRVVK